MATANHVLLRRITLTASAASVTFDSIPQTGYTDLKIVWSGRRESGAGYAIVDFNGLSTANFSHKALEGNGASAYSFVAGNTNYAGPLVASTDTANTFSNCEMLIPNYTSANPKSFTIDAVSEHNGTTAYADMIAGLWNNTAAITAVKLSPHNGTNFVAGSSFSLYGIADVNTTPALAPKADGGDIIKTDGTYWYHAFLSSGSFKPQVNLTADVLVVGGGGGAGSWYGGGGGGAGGVTAAATQALTPINYSITVGGGGAAAGNASGTTGTAGVSSTALGITSGSGGGGQSYGAGAGTMIGGTSGTPQSNSGGTGYVYSGGYSEKGGGGGGSGGAGTSPSASQYGAAGNGGAGLSTVTNWGSLSSALTTTNTGVSGYIAGGGAGGRARDTTSGTAGSGGGGAGATANDSNGFPGTANTGSGGGGNGGNGTGGAGASGIVIIRYAV